MGLFMDTLTDFNPRSRVGNDCVCFECNTFNSISIHVPAWGTTVCALNVILSTVFQSTFPRGERRKDLTKKYKGKIFQSTFPRGERPGTRSRKLLQNYFNPRSRVGNDTADGTKRGICKNFNPRSRVGNDGISLSDNRKMVLFQSTFPRGERLYKDSASLPPKLFQSTFPRGERRCYIYHHVG